MRALTRWGPPLRIACRDARRHKGRTALILVMIALPILAATVIVTMIRSVTPTDATFSQMTLGDTAQARLTADCIGTTMQDVRGGMGSCAGTEEGELATEDQIAGLLPDGDVLLAAVTSDVAASSPDRAVDSLWVTEVDVTELPGLYVTVDGELPTRQGEIALSRPMAETLDVTSGEHLTVQSREEASVEVRITGVFVGQRQDAAVALPGTVPGLADAANRLGKAWYVVGDAPVTWDNVLHLNDIGVTAVSRAVIADPPDPAAMPISDLDFGSTSYQTIGIVAAVVGVGLLEVVLLIGPAFAVGARRSTRQLGLVAANGGAPRDLRRIVLASGLVLGLTAGVAGAVLGVGAAGALTVVLRARDVAIPNFIVPWAEAAGLVLVAVLLGAAAAWLPARRAAGQDVVAALAGHRREATPRRAVPWVGLVLTGLGLAGATAGALTSQVTLLLGGALVLEIGLILAAGGIITLVGRLAPRLGPAGRIALRDAARQRGRTAPAVAAVLAAVAGMTAAGVYVVSDARHHQQMFQPFLAEGHLEIGLDTATGSAEERTGRLDDAVAVLDQELSIEHSAPVYVAALPDREAEFLSIYPEMPPEKLCPIWELGRAPTAEEEAAYADDPRCDIGEPAFISYASRARAWTGEGPQDIYIDDGSSVRLFGLPGAEEAADALTDGKILVTDPDYLDDDGTVLVRFSSYDPSTGQNSEPVLTEFPAEHVPWTNHTYQVILTPQAAQELGLVPVVVGMIAAPERPADAGDVAAANAAVAAAVDDITVRAELPQERGTAVVLLALVGAAALVGLAATWVSVGLAAADSRPDLATLAAVGAAPRTRKRIVGAQAAVISLIGVPLGVLTGIALGAVFVTWQANVNGHDPTWQVLIPWPMIAATLVTIPLLAVLGSMAATRSTLPLTRQTGL
ncbi:ABC transporter permease [Georgenia subflava]|uniref:FtsX-like permease family protein n=1 Tax=Georgenia subflava TaxID=1622177 RepID=A0A6N7EGS5_9MICO|nr:ABC transporter permease [Georgenia subflava]MPV35865.1 FtsX-like permease family protein [Georgenia subflava]